MPSTFICQKCIVTFEPEMKKIAPYNRYDFFQINLCPLIAAGGLLQRPRRVVHQVIGRVDAATVAGEHDFSIRRHAKRELVA